jgi:formaldehyde-activating enzyme
MAKKVKKVVKPSTKAIKPAAKAGKTAKAGKPTKTSKPAPIANIRIGMRTGEALVEAEQAWSAAEPEIVIGELDGPVGYAIANLLGNQVKGHTKVWAILNSDVQVKPATLMVSKVTVNNNKYTNILMGSVQAGIANGVLDAVRSGIIPKEKAYELGIIISVWLDPSVVDAEDLDHDVLFNVHREATFKAIKKAMNNEPTIEWLLENQATVPHYFHQLGKDKQL